MLKLNIGCGRKLKKGYINIDIQESKRSKPDVVADCKDLPYESDTVDIIESYHLLEHMGHAEAITALTHWYKLLKPGGCVVMELPDLEQDMIQLIEGNTEMIHSIFGRQRNEWDYHKYGYTKGMLTKILTKIGFQEVSFEDPTDYHTEFEPCLRVVAKK